MQGNLPGLNRPVTHFTRAGPFCLVWILSELGVHKEFLTAVSAGLGEAIFAPFCCSPAVTYRADITACVCTAWELRRCVLQLVAFLFKFLSTWVESVYPVSLQRSTLLCTWKSLPIPQKREQNPRFMSCWEQQKVQSISGMVGNAHFLPPHSLEKHDGESTLYSSLWPPFSTKC